MPPFVAGLRVPAAILCIMLLASCAPATTVLPTTTATVLPPTGAPTPPAATPTPPPTASPDTTPLPPLPLGLVRWWRATTGDSVWQIGAVDVEGDGQLEVYAASYDHRLHLLEGDGTVRWSYATRAPLYAARTHDLNGDGRAEFLCGGDDGTLYAVNGDGSTRWTVHLGGRITHIAVGDLDGSGRPEVIAANWQGDLLILETSGRERARVALEARPTVLEALDLYGDGRATLLVGTADGVLRALDVTGNRRWQQELEEPIRALAPVKDAGDGRAAVVVAGRSGAVTMIDGDGTARWARHTAGTVLSLAVLPQDGLVLLGRTDNLLALSAADGRPAWQVPVAHGAWTIALLEYPTDPVIAVGTDNGTILLLDNQGQLRGSTRLPSRVHTLVWADLDRRGQSELLARSGDYVYAFRQDLQGEAGQGSREVATFPYWPEPAPFPSVPAGHVSLVVVGDIMLGRSIEVRMEAYGSHYPFRGLEGLLHEADIVVGNLECVLALAGELTGQPYILRAHPDTAAALQGAGLDVLNLANNHALDYGPAGLEETIAALEAAGIAPVGGGPRGYAPVITEVNGLRVAFLGRNAAADSPPGIAGVWETEALQRDVRAARDQADVVVLLLHTGQDPTPEPSAEQRALARAAIEAGAALVVGYHRYLTLDTEVYGEGLIAYALGDFVSDVDVLDAARDGAVLRVLLSSDGLVRADWLPTRRVNDVQPQAVAAPGGRVVIAPLLTRVTEPLPPAPSPRASYLLSATLALETGQVLVHQEIVFPNTTGDSLSNLQLFVFPNARPGTFFLQEVELYQRGQWANPSYALAGTSLNLFFAEKVRPDETITVSLGYSLSLPLLSAQGVPPDGNIGYTADGRIVQLGHWYPQLAPYRRGYGWETWDYTPVGDPYFADLARYQATIALPEGYQLFAGAPAQVVGQAWHVELDPARDFALLAARGYGTAVQRVGGITVTSAFRQEHGEAGRAALLHAAQSLALFQRLYGPYPYDNLTVVEGEMFGGMEYSSMILVGSLFYAAYQNQVDYKERTVLTALTVHEVAHQWWYNVVGNDQVREPWLDEALARYSEVLYYEAVYTRSVDWWWESRIDAWGPAGYLDSTIYDYPDTMTYVHNLYGQGAHFMHDLRFRLGDEVFFLFLQRYYREYAWQRATRRDFFRLVGETGIAVDDLMPLYFGR